MAGMEPIEGTEEAFTSNDNDNLTEWITRTIDLADGCGDVKIILRYGPRKKNKLQELLVSSDAMARASPVWRKMFTGGWAETKADRPLVLDHTEDSYKAVVTIMNIIHLRFSDVPPTVTLAGLKAIATFTDQRMATALVVPWIERWLSHLSGSVDTVGCETEWLWIAWEFGLAAVFDRISRRLAYGAPVPVAEPSPPPSTFGNFGRTGARAFSPAAEEHGDVFNDVNFDNLPPEVEDVVKGARLAMVGRMLTEVYDYFDALLQWTGSPKACDGVPAARLDCAHSEADCIRLQIGSLFPVLNSLGLWPKSTPGDVLMSPAHLRTTLLGIRLSDCNNNGFRGLKKESRSPCNNPTSAVCGNFDETLDRIKHMPLQHQQIANEMQLNHLQAQHAKVGLECAFAPHAIFKRSQ
ncbi:hypothetical protein CDEST_15587 [Colletotrichum destructivum]|uniref:Nuclear pore protein n=1 Tax=Colletotrichum destructivum TaxID=34406 RepID=A0AAX4J5B4_9PEZI|nr:hypothetical protein CDEST_15587 [Colletotrichum destructivum]